MQRRRALKTVIVGGGIIVGGELLGQDHDELQTEPVPAGFDANKEFRFGPSGGFGGVDFGKTIGRVTSLTIRSGSQVDNFQASGTEGTIGPVGGGGGDEVEWKPRGGLKRIEGTAHPRVIHQLQFKDNAGRDSPLFGTTRGADDFVFECPDGFEIVGFFGRAGRQRLDAIGVIIRARKG